VISTTTTNEVSYTQIAGPADTQYYEKFLHRVPPKPSK